MASGTMAMVDNKTFNVSAGFRVLWFGKCCRV